MREKQSRVNFKKLVTDLADMYHFDTFDVVVTELTANALDAGARAIAIDWDHANNTLVMTDDGRGMTFGEFEQYHDLAAELKTRGDGIGFAGVGAKISFNIARRVLTETRHDGKARASDWYWGRGDTLRWQSVAPKFMRADGTRVEIHFDPRQTPRITAARLQQTLRRHYRPLFIAEFARAYQASKRHAITPRFKINGRLIPQTDLATDAALVARKRYGLDGESFTLAELGARHRVTRERIRQIQNKARRKIAQRPFQRALWWAFVADFMQSGCALVVAESSLNPRRKFLHAMIDLSAHPVPELGMRIIGAAQRVDDYRGALRRDSPDEPAADALPFLPARDRETLVTAENERREKRAGKNMSRMLQKALRKLGRAAHYTEIARTCNRLFPENERSAHNWHAALLRFAGREQFGIVWIGRRGVYGLKEHGYSRPGEGLHKAVPRIVREQFAATNRPVPLEAVLRELGKQRREFNPGSVKMALIFSDQIEKANGGYLPAAPQDAGAESKYDIAAAMRAFTAGSRETGDG